MSEYELTDADKAAIEAAHRRFQAKRAALEASWTPEQRAAYQAQREASRRELERWNALSPEEKEVERAERQRKEDEFWESAKLREDDPRFNDAIATFAACQLACTMVSQAFAKYGKLNRRERKRIEHRVYTILRKTSDVRNLRKLKVRISFKRNDSWSREYLQHFFGERAGTALHTSGGLREYFGEYTAVLQAWDADDPKNYDLRAGLPSPTQSRQIFGSAQASAVAK